MSTKDGHARATGGHAGGGGGGARTVVLARHRSTMAGQAECEVHLIPLPLRSDDGHREVISALCGSRLRIDHLDTVTPGEGRWCTSCFVAHVVDGPSAAAPARARKPASPDCTSPDCTQPGLHQPGLHQPGLHQPGLHQR